MKCTVTRHGDLWFDTESRDFIDKQCVVLKRTKGGLIQIALQSDPKKTYSVGQRNILITSVI